MSNASTSAVPWPEPDFTEFGEVETKPLPRIQRLTSSFLARNWSAIPHVTHNDEVDVTALDARRTAHSAETGVKATLLVPVIKALAAGLRAYPVFNTSLKADGTSLVWKKYVHVGVAIDTPAGLLVGVVRDCDKKPSATIAEEVLAISDKARTKGLSLGEMSGGCITVSSLGHIGGTSFTPIVNAPEVAILGLTRIQQRPAPAADGGCEWRKMLPLSLSYDHRVINGVDAARFCRLIGEELAAYRFQ